MNLHDKLCWLTTDNDHGSYLHGVRTGPMTTMNNSDPEAITIGCVEYGNVHNYLIKTPGPYSMEELEAYKSLEAYYYYIK